MALSDLEVFSERIYTDRVEMLDYRVNMFNEATNGGFRLTSGIIQGDYFTEAFWDRIVTPVRRRNAYGSGTIAQKELTMGTQTKVKVAAGTYPINLEPNMLNWIKKDAAAAAAFVAKQIAEADFADRVNLAIGCYVAAVSQTAAVVHDATDGTLANSDLVTGASKFGDAYSSIVAWVMHSKVFFDLHQANLANATNLFDYGTVKVMRDTLGIPYIIADNARLVYTSTGTKYRTLGLTPGAVVIEDGGDYTDNLSTLNGNENIARTLQGEWTENVAVKGYSWDTANGGASPTDAALFTSGNWDKIVTSDKHGPGVLVNSQ